MLDFLKKGSQSKRRIPQARLEVDVEEILGDLHGCRMNRLETAEQRSCNADEFRTNRDQFTFVLGFSPSRPEGKRTINRVLPGSVSTSILPPNFSVTMRCTISRPNPVPEPCGLVVKNASKMRGNTSAGIPSTSYKILDQTE